MGGQATVDISYVLIQHPACLCFISPVGLVSFHIAKSAFPALLVHQPAVFLLNDSQIYLSLRRVSFGGIACHYCLFHQLHIDIK